MHDERDRGGRDRHHDDSGNCDAGHPRAARGDGPDTRFLQLEMSQVLYGEAEGVTKDAFRQLLMEAAKDHLRDRFGAEISQLAEIAVDQFMEDIVASLEIEARIEEHNHERGHVRDRLHDLFRGGAANGDDEEQDDEES